MQPLIKLLLIYIIFCLQELSNQITALQKEVSLSEAALRQEKLAHNTTKDELENLRNQMSVVKEEVDSKKIELETKMANDKKIMDTELKAKDQVGYCENKLI